MENKENQIGGEVLSLASTPTWSVATVLTVFIVLSLIVDRCIHRLSDWLRETNRKPLLAAVQKMKDEMMLLGLTSLLLTAVSASIPNICIPSKFQRSIFAPCPKFEHDDGEIVGKNISEGWIPVSRRLNELDRNTCKVGYMPFISSEGLEELDWFVLVMAVTHVSYSCLAMLFAFMKLRSWRAWEDEAHVDRDDALTEIARETTVRRQTILVRYHASIPVARNRLLIWVTCFLRQFAPSVVRADYLTLREAFITKHNLSARFDFYSYLIHSMEEEFQRIVGVSGPLWGFVVAFMLFNMNGSNLYFWITVISVTLVLLVGTKLQHVIATLTLGNAGIAGFFAGPRDELFWFNRPALLLFLMHFILFQNAFELALLFWSLWHRQSGFGVCFFHNDLWLYLRLTLGFVGQSLFIYSTLPLYALVNQMGTNHKAALIPQWIRETIHGWKKAAQRRRRHGHRTGESAINIDNIELQMMSREENEHQSIDIADNVTELQPPNVTCPSPVTDGPTSMVAIMSSSVPPMVNVDEDV